MTESSEVTVIHHATLVDMGGAVSDGWVVLEGGRIADVGTGDTWKSFTTESADIIDAGGALVTPGFVDVHCHGGGGAGFDGSPDDAAVALATHRAHGSVGIVASLVTNPVGLLESQLGMLREVMADQPGLLGAHLEGPFLAPSRKGAHAAQHLRHPTSDLVSRLLIAGRGVLKQITIAPELPGALEAISRFVDAGVVVAVGHTAANHDQTQAAFDRGATVVTHAFNAMAPIEGRHPGPLVAAFNDPRVTLELIADGIHVDPRVIAMAFSLAPGRVAVVTDALAIAGVGASDMRLGDNDVEVRDGRAYIAGTDTLAGSLSTQDHSLRTLILAGIGLPDAVGALTAAPARALGGNCKEHHLVAGASAEVVLFDLDMRVARVF